MRVYSVTPILRTIQRCSGVSSNFVKSRNISTKSAFQKQSNWYQKTQKHQFHQSSAVSKQDFYKTLGVDKKASSSEIKKAYYQLAKKYHPDTNKGDKNAQEKFIEIQEAYECLSDEQKRAAYDQFGHGFDGSGGYNPGAGGFDGFGGFGQGGFSQGFGGGQGFNPEDLFSQFFGGGFGKGRAGRSGFDLTGEDIQVNMNISFMEAAKGVNKKVRIQPIINCSTCKGHGTKDAKKPDPCPSCHGSGQQIFNTMQGILARTCSTCDGSGAKVKKGSECSTCGGMGRVRDNKLVDVNIPAGVDDGVKLRVSGEGDSPIEGQGRRGDLFVKLRVQPSQTFKRSGPDVHVEAKVPFQTAILGGFIRIPTIDGDVELKITPGSQSNDTLVLKGKGISKLNSRNGKGDQYVNLHISVPKKLTDKQKELIEEFSKTLNNNDKKKGNDDQDIENKEGSNSNKKGRFFNKIFDKFMKDNEDNGKSKEDIKKESKKEDDESKKAASA
ncbi:chaperone DnaJ [Neoconidiobolus thromboides FSU 785]|nr:chaperone DnaJ [Neoconidiobolus thromboides FSU 785]